MDLDVVKLYKWGVYQQKMRTMLAWPCTLRGNFLGLRGSVHQSDNACTHIFYCVPNCLCAATSWMREGRQAKTHHPGFEVTHSFHVIYIIYCIYTGWWVVWNTFFSIQLGIIIPTDFHSMIFQRGRWLNHQPAILIYISHEISSDLIYLHSSKWNYPLVMTNIAMENPHF